jgi:hypothetical protein
LGGTRLLLGKSRAKRHSEWRTGDDEEDASRDAPAPAAGVLLWTLSLSSAMLGLVSISSGSTARKNLLWIFPGQPRIRRRRFFGPYTYRTNAAQYFNLVWPSVSAFGEPAESRRGRPTDQPSARGRSRYVVFAAVHGVMAACPIVATVRGGTLILFVSALVALVILFPRQPHRASRGRVRGACFWRCLRSAGGGWKAA